MQARRPYPIARMAQVAIDDYQMATAGRKRPSEPALDYVAVKIPSWPFDTFLRQIHRRTEMKPRGGPRDRSGAQASEGQLSLEKEGISPTEDAYMGDEELGTGDRLHISQLEA